MIAVVPDTAASAIHSEIVATLTARLDIPADHTKLAHRPRERAAYDVNTDDGL